MTSFSNKVVSVRFLISALLSENAKDNDVLVFMHFDELTESSNLIGINRQVQSDKIYKLVPCAGEFLYSR
jgi:hypothetical protein